MQFCIGLFAAQSFSATYTVINTNDSGAGSLRQAILDANANGGADTIDFQISGGGPFTISPSSALPSLSGQTLVNATTQLGYTTQPLIELNGASAGSTLGGLQLAGGNSTIRGLAINRFTGHGILISSSSNTIQGNYIGTDVTGNIARPNTQSGVYSLNFSYNQIGGTNTADRNVISGGNNTGIYIQNGTGNFVQGNYIGVNAAGTSDLGNLLNGVVIYNSSANVIGGAAVGARNIIAGNDASGVNLNLAGATGNLIQGNYIGLNAAGSSAISNSSDGITLNDAPGNLIGGTNSTERNLISGNGQSGVFLNGNNSRQNFIAGNYIGTDPTGLIAVGNTLAGLTLLNAVSNNIGNSLVASRNVISGNRTAGIFFSTNSVGNSVQNNFIGVAANGTNALGNTLDGVALNYAAFNQIGTASGRNVISGNTNNGVLILSGGSGSNTVQGNYIGTDVSGRTAVNNTASTARSGVRVESPANQIGGSAPGAGNLISGNGYLGVWLANSNAIGNFLLGNLIGTAVGGTNGLGNSFAGIALTDAASNQIGGITVAERNLISANGFPANNGGIYVEGSKSKYNKFFGNYVGTDVTGQNALGNRAEGIYIGSGSSNFIGSELPRGGNLISGNGTRAIYLNSASWNLIQGNFIGMAADGETGMSNGYATPLSGAFSMVDLTASSNNLVGGTNSGAGNRIGYAPVLNLPNAYYAGVRVRDGSVNNAILGNAIFANGGLGIDVSNYAVTDNDPFIDCDSDSGGNQRQNFPVLLDAQTGSSTRVRGYLHSASSQTYRLQFFSNPTCDSSPVHSGYGEGKTFLGETMVVLGGICSNSFTAYVSGDVPAGYVITATATDPANNTSEFSACVPVSAAPRLTIATVSATQISLAWTNTATGFVLKQTTNLSPPVVWTTVTNVPVNSAGQFQVSLLRQPGNRFYLLNFE